MKITDPALIAHLNKATKRELLEKNFTENEANDIIEQMLENQDLCEDIINEFSLDSLRVCTNCGKPMFEGYLVDNVEPYCSEECLMENMGWNKKTLNLALQQEGDQEASVSYTCWE